MNRDEKIRTRMKTQRFNFGWFIILGPVIIILAAMVFENSPFLAVLGRQSAWEEARNYVVWGRSMLRDGQQREANLQFEAALEIIPDMPDALMYLGIIRHLNGRDTDAFALLNRAIAQDPRDKGSIYNNLGLIYEKLGETDRAIEQYYKAAELGIDQDKIWRNIGMLEYSRENWPDAIAAYENSISNRPTLENLYLEMLHREAISEDNDEYIDDLRARLQDGFTEEANALYFPEIADHFLKNNSTLAEDHVCLALAYEAEGDTTRAIVNLKKALEIQSGRVELYNHLAVLYARLGMIDEAEETFAACLKVDPKNQGAQKGLNELCPRLRRKN